MIIRRYKSFSKKDKDNNKKEIASAVALAGGGLGTKVLGDKLNYKSWKYSDKKFEDLMSKPITKEDSEVMKKLLEKAKKQGVDVCELPRCGGSAYSPYKDTIVLDKNQTRSSVLSHELGHAQYFKGGRSKNIFARAAHKTYNPMLIPGGSHLKVGKKKIHLDKLARRGFFIHGVASGYKNEKDNQQGRKSNLWKKTRSVAFPAIAVAPILAAEGSASLKGLKMMKKAGASKELLKESKKTLGHAFNSYVSGVAGRHIVAGASGELVGRGLAKATNQKTKEVPDKTKKE